MRISAILLCCLAAKFSKAQDTIRITAQSMNSKVLKEGTHRYLVYFKMGKDATRTQTQFWTRTIKRTAYNGTPVIEVNQEWENKDSIIHVVKSIVDAKTMQSIYHKTWWKWPTSRDGSAYKIINTIVDVENKKVELNGASLSDADTANQAKRIWDAYKSSAGKYFLNWHLDLEVFPVLPYRAGVTFIIPFYDPGTASPFQEVAYTVSGSAKLIGYDDQQIDCWLLTHKNKGGKEVFWISKKTKEVLKLEEGFGNAYRYKVKLVFSM